MLAFFDREGLGKYMLQGMLEKSSRVQVAHGVVPLSSSKTDGLEIDILGVMIQSS